jgi:hypothetical protein
MKPFSDIEKFVRLGKPEIKTGEQMDKRTLDDSYAAMEETIASKSKDYKSVMSEFLVRNKVTKLIAAVAAIIIAISLFFGRDGRKPEIPTTRHREIIQETKLISMMSMRLSYQQGGFEALDRQFRDTLDVLGPRSSSISMQDLIEGINGS